MFAIRNLIVGPFSGISAKTYLKLKKVKEIFGRDISIITTSLEQCNDDFKKEKEIRIE